MEYESMLDPEHLNYWDFEILDGVSFRNCNRIHPLKQKDIQTLCEISQKDPHIECIMVFGSSTQFRCNSRSDIDLVVFRDDAQKVLPDEFFDVSSELDVFFTVGERLRKILYDFGVIVYRR